MKVFLVSIAAVLLTDVSANNAPRPVFPSSEGTYEQLLGMGGINGATEVEMETAHPTVGGGGGSYNTPNCLFKDDHNSWCFSSNNPILKIGWEWAQSTNTGGSDGQTSWNIQMLPYISTQAEMTSSFILKRMATSDLKFRFQQFK